MSYVTQNTAWLADDSALPQAVRQLVARLFELADSPNPDSGPLLSTDVFAPDGVWHAPGGKPPIVGSEAIARSRDRAWDTVTRRVHTVQKAFGTGSGDRREVVLLGTLNQDAKDGNSIEVGYAAYIEVTTASSEAPRILTMRVYAA
ncbi:hypothetical protein Sste5346_003430 [Sporothrix stenoceras]|uniref:SnoaL-like domain-containing protein n=1 Tax=Sporothrix stenoceras TaxID=5173 RepID=A0ABR3ZEJ5_9PEZI